MAQIVRRGGQAAAKEMVPDTVGDHPAGERVVGPQEIVGQLQAAAVAGRIGGGINHREKPARYRRAWILVIPSDQQRLVAADGFLHGRHPLRGDDLSLQPAIVLQQRPDASELIESVLEQFLSQAGIQQEGLGIAGGSIHPGSDGPLNGPPIAGPQIGERLRLESLSLVENRSILLVSHGRGGRLLLLNQHRLADGKPRSIPIAQRQRHVAGRGQFDVDLVPHPIGEIV